MSLINYDSPDYQRLIQRAMASPLARSNPSAVIRQVQRQHTDNTMKRRLALNSSLLRKAALESDIADKNKMLDFRSRELDLADQAEAIKEQQMGLQFTALNEASRHAVATEGLRYGELGVQQKELKQNMGDLNSLWPIVPIAFNTLEGRRRADITNQLAQKQENLLDSLTKEYGGQINPKVNLPSTPTPQSTGLREPVLGQGTMFDPNYINQKPKLNWR